MNCLVLYVDLDFIAGIVHVNGQTHPVVGNEEVFLWLYFFNNKHGNTVTYGKNNKIPFDKGEPNYYGRFFELIEDDTAVFPFGGIKRPAIELLKVSGLLDSAIRKYREVTLEVPEQIPTLISFSPSMSDLAKQRIVTYLRQTSFDVPQSIFSQTSFDIIAHSVSPAELAAHYCHLITAEYNVGIGDTVLFLKATNSSLRLMTLVFVGEYFSLRPENTTLYPERGTDPRKRAISNFVVNEINNYTGVLTSTEEKIRESEWFEQNKAEKWLEKLDRRSMPPMPPLRIYESFQITPNMYREVLVRSNIIEQNTGHYIQELVDILEHYRHGARDVSAIIFWGDCFRNTRVRDKFAQTIPGIRQIFLSSADINMFLSAYPVIDFNHPITTEEEAQQLYIRALDQFNRGELRDALVNVENALEKVPGNDNYINLRNEVRAKIKEREDKVKRDKLISEGTSLRNEGKYDEALSKFEEALIVSYSDDLLFTIRSVKTKILQQKYSSLLFTADSFLNVGNYDAAANNYAAAKQIAEQIRDPRNIREAENRIDALETKIKQIKQYETLTAEGDALFLRDDCDAALNKYRAAQKINDTPQIADKIADAERIKQQREHNRRQQQRYNTLIDEGDALFLHDDCNAALNKYREAREIDDTPQVADKILLAERAVQQREQNLQRYKNFLDDGDALCSRGDYDTAFNSFNAAKQIAEQIKDPLRSREIENRIFTLETKVRQRKQYEILITEGDALLSRDDCNAALSKYREAQKIDPTPQIADKISAAERMRQQQELVLQQRQRYKTLIDEGLALYSQGDYASALNKYNSAKQIAEQLNYQHGIRETETRIHIVEQNIREQKQKEQQHKVLLDEANSLFLRGECEEAWEKYKQANEIINSRESAAGMSAVEPILRILRKADELLKNGKFDEAEKAYDNALSIHPDCSRARKQLSMIAKYRSVRNQADTLLKEQKPQEALNKYEEAQTLVETVELDHRIALVGTLSIMLKQADKFLKEGNIDEAEKSYKGFLKTCREALSIETNNAHSEIQLSKIERYRPLYNDAQRMEKERKWAEATEKYEKAWKIIPNKKLSDKIEELSKRFKKFCNGCGAPIVNPNNRFCNKCGKPVR